MDTLPLSESSKFENLTNAKAMSAKLNSKIEGLKVEYNGSLESVQRVFGNLFGDLDDIPDLQLSEDGAYEIDAQNNPGSAPQMVRIRLKRNKLMIESEAKVRGYWDGMNMKNDNRTTIVCIMDENLKKIIDVELTTQTKGVIEILKMLGISSGPVPNRKIQLELYQEEGYEISYKLRKDTNPPRRESMHVWLGVPTEFSNCVLNVLRRK